MLEKAEWQRSSIEYDANCISGASLLVLVNSGAPQATSTKAAALEFLRRNSEEAAAKARTCTDEELDTAAPVGLSFGASVTAQFIIEDHALRHSWHHLAGIRRALRR